MKAWVTKDISGHRPREFYTQKPYLSFSVWQVDDGRFGMDMPSEMFPEIQPAPGECVEIELTAREVQR